MDDISAALNFFIKRKLANNDATRQFYLRLYMSE